MQFFSCLSNVSVDVVLLLCCAVRLLGMRTTREPTAKLSLRKSAIENATKGQQWPTKKH